MTDADLSAARDLLRRVGLSSEDLGAVPFDLRTIRHAGRVVGCVAVERYGTSGLLRSLAVAPEAQGAGWGRRLVEWAEAAARERQLDALYLLTTAAAPFFERQGYAPVERAALPEAVGRSSQVSGICPASAEVLQKQLRKKPQ